MDKNLVVIAAYGTEHLHNFVYREFKYPTLIIRTDLPKEKIENDLCTCMPFNGYDTGAYLWAYWTRYADNYLFLQDSLIPHDDNYAHPFFEQLKHHEVVAWAGFPFPSWDSPQQEMAARYNVGPATPILGIFGPIFAARRTALDSLAASRLLPPFPTHKESQQGKEREWAIAFKQAGIHVNYLGPAWNPRALATGSYPCFTKLFPKRTGDNNVVN